MLGDNQGSTVLYGQETGNYQLPYTKKIGSTGDNQGSTTEITLYGHGTGIYLLSKKIGSTSS